MFQFKMERELGGERIYLNRQILSFNISLHKCRDMQEDVTRFMMRFQPPWWWISAHRDLEVRAQTAKNQIFQAKRDISVDLICHLTSRYVRSKEIHPKVSDKDVIALSSQDKTKSSIRHLDRTLKEAQTPSSTYPVLKQIEAIWFLKIKLRPGLPMVMGAKADCQIKDLMVVWIKSNQR